jgi:hypothetical protein
MKDAPCRTFFSSAPWRQRHIAGLMAAIVNYFSSGKGREK